MSSRVRIADAEGESSNSRSVFTPGSSQNRLPGNGGASSSSLRKNKIDEEEEGMTESYGNPSSCSRNSKPNSKQFRTGGYSSTNLPRDNNHNDDDDDDDDDAINEIDNSRRNSHRNFIATQDAAPEVSYDVSRASSGLDNETSGQAEATITEGEDGKPRHQVSCPVRWFHAAQSLRLEFILFTVLVGLFFLAFYYLIALLNKDVQYHKQCVECFHTSNDGGSAFDEKQNRCLIVANITQLYQNLTHQQLQEFIVFDSTFCGAAKCQLEVLLPTVRPIPYGIMFASCMFGIIVAIFVNFLRLRVVKPWWRRRCYPAWNWETPEPNLVELLADASAKDPTNESLARLHLLFYAANSFGAIDPYWYLFLYVFTVFHFCYIVVATLRTSDTLSMNKKFEVIFMIWLNAGDTLNVICFTWSQILVWAFLRIVRREFDKENKFLESTTKLRKMSEKFEVAMSMPLMLAVDDRSKKIAAGVFHLVPVLLTPCLFLLILPGVVVYLPIAILILIPSYLVYRALSRWGVAPDVKTSDFKIYLWFFFLRLVGSTTSVVFFQTFASYGVMTFDATYPTWLDVIRVDFTHRTMECYGNSFLNHLEIYNIGLAGLIMS